MADFRDFLVILLGLFVASCAYIDAGVDTSIMDQICNEGKFGMLNFLSPGAVSTITEAVVTGTPKAEMLDYYASNTVAGVYAHGLCTSSLSSDECSDCLKSAHQQLLCSNQHVGAQIKLRDCRLRYEIYPFHNDY